MWCLVVAALAHCNYTPGGTYPPILYEYERAVRVADYIAAEGVVEGREHPAPVRRARRSLSTTPVRHFPFGAVTVNGSISRRDRTTVYRAVQYASVLHTIPADESPIDLVFLVGTASPAGTSIIGSWDGSVIRLHTLSIDNDNLLFIVTLHEIYHVLHFGTAAFASLTTPEYAYTGPNTSACVANHSVRTDTAVSHWRDNTAPFSTSFMEPTIPSDGNVKVDRCTATAVTEGRVGWTLMACDTAAHCPTNYTCTGATSHLVGWCIHNTSVVSSTRRNPAVRQFPALTAFVFGVFVFINLLIQCARKHPHHPAAKLLSATE